MIFWVRATLLTSEKYDFGILELFLNYTQKIRQIAMTQFGKIR